MTNLAPITPDVLKWARESARISISSAASRISTTEEKIKQWENGERSPTISQAKKLAEYYKRPFALLFLPDIPNDFMPLQDFRRTGSSELGTASLFMIREIQEKQAWLSEFNEENEMEPLPFIGKFSLNDPPIHVADDILRTLEIDPYNYSKASPFKVWLRNTEANGIYVSRSSFIHSRLVINVEELQGFAIADIYAPFVFLNTGDWDAPTLFTLVHELAHLWINEPGISNNTLLDTENIYHYHPVELFCNEVAATALIPAAGISLIDFSGIQYSEIYRQSRKWGVSSFAFLVRAFNLGLLSIDQYRSLRDEAEHNFQLFLKQEEIKKVRSKELGNKGPNYFITQLSKNGRMFTQTVLEAYKGGQVSSSIASQLLHIKVNKFSSLETLLYK